MNKIFGLYLAPLLLGGALFSCSKDEKTSDIISVDQIRQMPAITLTFDQEVSELKLLYTLANDDSAEAPAAFVDLNNNRKYNKGESLEKTSSAKDQTLSLSAPSKTIRLYGNFARLEVKNTGLASINGDGLSSIDELKIQNASMERGALDRLIALLGSGTNKSISFDEMRTSSKQINALVEKGWTVTNSAGNAIDPLQDLLLVSVTGSTGSELKLPIASLVSRDNTLWVDANLNGVKDAEEVSLNDSSQEIVIPLESGQGAVAIRGNIESLSFDSPSQQVSHKLSLSILRNVATHTLKLGSGLGLVALHTKEADRLREVSVDTNPLTEFTFPTHYNLRTISIKGAQFETIDCSALRQIQMISLQEGKLKDIKLPRTSARYTLRAGNNELTRLDLSKSPNIIELDVHQNKLKELILWENDNRTLGTIDVSGNELTELNLDKFQALGQLKAGGNQLTSIDLNPRQEGPSPLSFVDLSGSTKLLKIDASKNRSLSQINLSNCPSFAFSNLLTMLRSQKETYYGYFIITVDNQTATASISSDLETALDEIGWEINKQ